MDYANIITLKENTNRQAKRSVLIVWLQGNNSHAKARLNCDVSTLAEGSTILLLQRERVKSIVRAGGL